MKNPELRQKNKQARSEWFQKYYQEIKNDPERWAARQEAAYKWKCENPEKLGASVVRSRVRNPEKWLWNQAKKRCLVSGREFAISIEDIVIPEYCPIMGIKLGYTPSERNGDSPSLDRIDSSKGYTKDNIMVISTRANRMKSDATQEQLIAFAKGILALAGGGAGANQL